MHYVDLFFGSGQHIIVYFVVCCFVTRLCNVPI